MIISLIMYFMVKTKLFTLREPGSMALGVKTDIKVMSLA